MITYLKHVLLIILLSITSNTVLADYYIYVENPDIRHYEVHWQGPGPNCYEKRSPSSETYGWIIHDNRLTKDTPLIVSIFGPARYMRMIETRCSISYSNKKLQYDLGCCCSIKKGNAGNTIWLTAGDYAPYETWICG